MSKLLCTYQNTPHSVTGVSPAEMFLKRFLQTLLTLVKPDMGKRVARLQTAAKLQRDGRTSIFREFDLY